MDETIETNANKVATSNRAKTGDPIDRFEEWDRWEREQARKQRTDRSGNGPRRERTHRHGVQTLDDETAESVFREMAMWAEPTTALPKAPPRRNDETTEHETRPAERQQQRTHRRRVAHRTSER